jgi:hypothetical protein
MISGGSRRWDEHTVSLPLAGPPRTARRLAVGRLGLAADRGRAGGGLSAGDRERARPGGAQGGDRGDAQRCALAVPYGGGVQHRGHHRPTRDPSLTLRLGGERLRRRGDAAGTEVPGDAGVTEQLPGVLEPCQTKYGDAGRLCFKELQLKHDRSRGSLPGHVVLDDGTSC